MQPVLIFVLLLAFWPPIEPPPTLNVTWTLTQVIVGLVICRALSELPSLYFAHALKVQPERRGRLLWRYYRWRQIHLGLLVAMYAYCILGLQWPTFVRQEMHLKNTILLGEFFILLPFLLGLLLSWESFYRVEKVLHQTGETLGQRSFWSRVGYVGFQARQHLGLVLLPLTLFVGLQETAQWLWPNLMQLPIPQTSICLAIGLMVLTAMPWLLTKIFLTTSLPDGPLRQRLTAAAARMNFSFTDLLIWHTRMGLANAMVTGFLPRPRYILLSDLLLDQLTPDEVEAVFCHEIGHLRHRHIPLYLLFMGLSIGVLTQTLQLSAHFIPEDVTQVLTSPNDKPLAMPPLTVWLYFGGAMAFVGGYIRFVFGPLSRSCERQADLFACKSLHLTQGNVFIASWSVNGSCNGKVHVEAPSEEPKRPPGLAATVPVFVSALEKVAELNGIPYEKPSWRHGSISHRVGFLQALAARPEQEPLQQRRWFGYKASLLTVLAITASILWLLGANPFLWSD